MNAFKVISFWILLPLLVLSCGNKSKSSQSIKVHIKYDCPISGYLVTGEFYPFYAKSETGQVTLRFLSLDGESNFVYSNVGETEDGNPEAPAKFTGYNICEYIIADENIRFHDGDTLVFQYNTTPGIFENSPLYYYAEFQFFDVDFDGEDEFLVSDYYRGRGGNNYEVYEITTEGLKEKSFEPFDRISNITIFDAEERVITGVLHDGVFSSEYTEYKIAPDGNSAAVIYQKKELHND